MGSRDDEFQKRNSSFLGERKSGILHQNCMKIRQNVFQTGKPKNGEAT